MNRSQRERERENIKPKSPLKPVLVLAVAVNSWLLCGAALYTTGRLLLSGVMAAVNPDVQEQCIPLPRAGLIYLDSNQRLSGSSSPPPGQETQNVQRRASVLKIFTWKYVFNDSNVALKSLNANKHKGLFFAAPRVLMCTVLFCKLAWILIKAR